MTVYFIRHGETFANREKRFAGVTDVALSPLGENQAKAVSLKLKDVAFDAIFSSDLSRAHHTALEIAVHQTAKVKVYSALREMNFGIWEGKTFEEIKIDAPDKLNEWFKSFEDFSVPEGESVLDMYRRVISFYTQEVLSLGLESDKKVVIVAHGGVIQALLSHLLFGDLKGYWRFSVENCGINKVEYVMGMPVVKGVNQ